MGEPRLLIDTLPITLRVEEAKDGRGKMVVRGEFAHCDRATANRRIYTEALMVREALRMAPDLSERKVLGMLEHPPSGKTSLNHVSHVITDLRVENGIVVGACEPLDTTAGKELQSLLRSGVKIGVSSRGWGSTAINERGEEVVQDDYRLKTFDFVEDPANHTSYPEVYYEEKEPDMAVKPTDQIDLGKQKEEIIGLVRSMLEETKAQIEEKLTKINPDPEQAKKMEEILSLLKKPVTEETAPPEKNEEVETLKAQLAEQAQKLQALDEEKKKLAETARVSQLKAIAEQRLAGDPHAKFIRKLLGDVLAFETPESLEQAISEAQSDLQEQAALVEQDEKRRQKELQLIEEDRQKMRARLEKLEEIIEKSTKLNSILSVELYAEKRLANHPKASEIRQVIESSEPDSQEKVDEIIDSFKEPARSPVDQEQLRARIRSITKGGLNSTPIEEENGPQALGQTTPNYNNLGIPISELKKLAGISPSRE